MAFNNFRTTFDFVGKLEVLKEETLKDGTVRKGSVRTTDSGFKSVVFNAIAGNQGKFYVQTNGFVNPVSFTLNENDSKGNPKKFEYKGGKQPIPVENITDLWKSCFRVFKAGKEEKIFYHSMDFTKFLESLIGKIEKGFVRLRGNVEKSMYNKRIIERYLITSIDFLDKKPVEEYFSVNEMFVYKRNELKGSTIPVYESLRLLTKNKGYKEFYFKSDKQLKFNKNYFYSGAFKDMELKDISILKDNINDLKEHEIGKIQVNYRPVINTTKIEDLKVSDKLEELPEMYKVQYNSLINIGNTKGAEKFLETVYKAVKVSEGGNFREYMIDMFDFTDLYNPMIKIAETMFSQDFVQISKENIEKAMSKENKGKMIYESMAILQREDVTDKVSDDIFKDTSDDDFNDSLVDSEEEVVEKKTNNETTDEVEKEEEVVNEKDENDKEETVEDKDENINENIEDNDSTDDEDDEWDSLF